MRKLALAVGALVALAAPIACSTFSEAEGTGGDDAGSDAAPGVDGSGQADVVAADAADADGGRSDGGASECDGPGLVLCDSFERADPFAGSPWTAPSKTLNGTLLLSGTPMLHGKSLSTSLSSSTSESWAEMTYVPAAPATNIRLRFWLWVPGEDTPTGPVRVAIVSGSSNVTVTTNEIAVVFDPAASDVRIEDASGGVSDIRVPIVRDQWVHLDFSVGAPPASPVLSTLEVADSEGGALGVTLKSPSVPAGLQAAGIGIHSVPSSMPIGGTTAFDDVAINAF